MIRRMTPILHVDTIEPSLPFWCEGLGFQITARVPEEGPLVFASLERDGQELMYQTFAALPADKPGMDPRGATCLYVEVGDIEAAVKATAGAPVISPLETTFYGSQEFYVREPGGHIIGFAQPAAG